MSLTVDDFTAFHKAVHENKAPFDWQQRLLRKIVTDRSWPRVLDLPTGCGKTTCIDIALFALAVDAINPPDQRWCPRRIAMVVDRRVVVDQAAERGRILREVLNRSEDPAVVAVRGALASLASSEEDPLGVFTLRGGIPKDDGWARTPDQPLIIASTVDQIGSRLLIQGYGVSTSMRPVHAALVGNDVLLLLDEVHLSHPFKQTLERLSRLRQRFSDNGLPRRFHFAFLSATPGDVEGQRFGLLEAELAPESPLGPRLHAKKPTRLVPEVSGRHEVAIRISEEARALTSRHKLVAAVVNRVDTALQVFESLRKSSSGDFHVVLVTGRMRPLDRDDVLGENKSRIAAGKRVRSQEEQPMILVGTQCIEAGADFDFDALVTESASFDSLRQRFGRVNRLGEYVDAQGNSKAEGVIVHDCSARVAKRDKAGKIERKSGQVVMVDGDPVYGDTIVKTMKWLKSQIDATGKKRKKKAAPPDALQIVDFGTRSLLNAPDELVTPKASAPALLPAYLDLWSQTAPPPFVAPEPALFLHGPRRGPEDVNVIWRADVEDADLQPEAVEDVISAVTALRPSAMEAVSLPYLAARRWLAGEDSPIRGVSDVEGEAEAEDDEKETGAARRALRWMGDKSEVVDASTLRPGDTLVVPVAYGGIDAVSKSFNPNSMGEVGDLAERASLLARGRPALRLHPRVLAGLGISLNPDDPNSARRHLADIAPKLNGWMMPWAEKLGKGGKAFSVTLQREADGWIVISGAKLEAGAGRRSTSEGKTVLRIEEEADVSTEDEDSPFGGSEITLDRHTKDVHTLVGGYCQRLGIPDRLAEDLSLAAWLHDIGKADTRFQRMLRGGHAVAFYRDKGRILAKSSIPAASRAERKRAQQLSGYPQGARHEVQSVAMIETARAEVASKANDIELVLHLVASHHGHCRPFAPAVEERDSVNVELRNHGSERFGELSFEPTTSMHNLQRLDSPIADRFWRLIGKYGWLELCWLETVLRLADHRASESEAA